LKLVSVSVVSVSYLAAWAS